VPAQHHLRRAAALGRDLVDLEPLDCRSYGWTSTCQSVPAPVLAMIGGLFGRRYRKEIAPVRR
jgi:hypothetical protein